MDQLADLEAALAFHRRHPIQQDPRHRGTLRLGAERGSLERRPPAVGATAVSRAAAQCVHPSGAGAGTHQGRRCAASAGTTSPPPSPFCRDSTCAGLMCVPPPQPDAAAERAVFARLAGRARGSERPRPQARYTVDGNERGFRVRHRRGRDAGADRHGAIRRPLGRFGSRGRGQYKRGGHEQYKKAGLHRRRQHGRRADQRPDQARPASRSGWWLPIQARISLSAWCATMALQTAADNAAAVQGAEVVVLAVKPQQMRGVALGLAPHLAAAGRW